jgi:hypothetical protein
MQLLANRSQEVAFNRQHAGLCAPENSGYFHCLSDFGAFASKAVAVS